ncbi:MAG: phenylalanine--tRNA ligase subunit beta [Patescibacteria group bacterium]|jgi:phenylalanyl-tRNA synthetase beta chain
MNILASYNWIREYLNTTLSADEFAKELSLKSMSVEKIDALWGKFEHMVVGVIKEIKAHPNANKLRIAVTDIGEKTVEVVCGGSNLEVGQRVFVALPGAKVKWHGEGELVTLAEVEIRGVKSIGMICAAAEVGFDKIPAGEHEIWDLSKVTDAKAGTPIVEALELNDTIFDIEVTTNRPDCMSIVGLAREGSASTDGQFTFAPLLLSKEESEEVQGFRVSINSKKCPRYMAAVVKNVKVGPSPWWLQKKLLLAGHRPINNIVDITNLVLHELGQPMHAFDASKIRGNQIVIRDAQKGEKLKALDGKEYELSKTNLIIADQEGPMAVAGVMGGEASSTTNETTTVVFEAAAFDAVSVRRTARDLNLYSDSQLVFEKGLSTEALPIAMARALELVQQLAGGTVEGLSDTRHEKEKAYKPRVYKTSTKKIRSRIGVDISDEQIEKILTKLGFMLTKKGHIITATVPFWRDHDIESEVDLTEEVARIYGYHNMPSTLPAVTPPPAVNDVAVVWERKLKRVLASLGYTEFFGVSLIDGKDLERYGITPLDAVKLLNPLAEDLSYLRPTLVPSILRDIEKNQATSPSARIFELSRVHLLSNLQPATSNLPLEQYRLVIADYGYDNSEAAFMRLKGTLERLGKETGVAFSLTRVQDTPRYHPSRAADIHAEINGVRTLVGMMGEVAPAYERAFGLEKQVFLIDLDLEALLPHLKKALRYELLSAFPASRRDLSFMLNERTAYDEIAAAVAGPLLTDISLTDIYRGAGVESGKKSLTLSLTFSANDRTLTSDEVENEIKRITTALEGKFGAALRG